MSKRKTKKSKRLPVQDEGSFIGKWKKTWAEKKTIILYLFAFFVFITLFFWIGEQEFFSKAQLAVTSVFAKISGGLLSLLGYDMTVKGDLLSTPDLRIQIKKGCDAIAPTMIYLVAVLAYPMKWAYKWRGILGGIAAIFVLNTIRIVSLFLAALYSKKVFDILHVDVWQVLFIFATLFFWLIWLRWAMRKEEESQASSSEKL